MHAKAHIYAHTFCLPYTIRELLTRGACFPFTTTKTVSSRTDLYTGQYNVNNPESGIEQEPTHYDKKK